MAPNNLDIDLLRSFVTGVSLGSFAKAAEQLGRSPSAISLQLRKLEEQAGDRLLHKQGRGLALTEAGEVLLGYARRLLELNDEALTAVRGPGITGWVRLGLPQDFAESWLPEVLARFTRQHPGARVEARVDRNAMLLDSLDKGELDLALVWDHSEGRSHGIHIAELPIVWIGPRSGFLRDPAAPLPLVGFPPPCIFRQAGLAALDAAGITWHMAFSSPGLSAVWAAVAAGLGVTPRTPYGLPAALKPIDGTAAGLPHLPALKLSLRRAGIPPSAAVERLAAILRETLTEGLHGATVGRR